MSVKKARPVRRPVSQTPAWVVPAAIVAGLAVLVAAFLIVRWYTTPLAPQSPGPDSTQQIVATITSLPASEFDFIGQGSVSNPIRAVSGAPLNGPTGKPEVFYYGAEFCPYCAAERWPLIIALGRFGKWSGLQTTTSSSTDVYPNTPTFTLRKASYSSNYIDFQSVEGSDRDRNPLQTLTAAQHQLIAQYDPSTSIPFVDLGNRYAFSGAMYQPDTLGGRSWQEIASSLQRVDTPQTKAILGSANLITAAVCKLTSDQPSSVCDATIQSLEQKLH